MAHDPLTSLYNHAEDLMAKMNDMRQRKFVCDFTVKVGELSIPVHRVVLASFSDYFEAMFTNDMKENRQGFVELKDVDAASFERCIEFMYTGRSSLTTDNVERVYLVADMLQCEKMLVYCVKYLANVVTEENWMTVKNIGDKLNLPQIAHLVEFFVADNLIRISKTEEFKKLDITEVLKYLKRGSSSNEGVLWNTALAWMTNHQDQERRFIDVLRVLNMENFPFFFTFIICLDEEIMKKSKTCQNHIIWAIFKKYNSGELRQNNCLRILSLAKSHGRMCPKGTVKQIHEFISQHYMTVFKHQEYLKLGVDDIIAIQRKIDRRMTMAAWYFSKAWVEHCPEKRNKFFPSIVENLDLKGLPMQFILATVLEDALVKGSESCKSKVIAALFVVVHYKELNLKHWFSYMKFTQTHQHLRKPRCTKLLNNYFESCFKAISSQRDFQYLASEQIFVFLKFQTVAEEYKWFVVLKWMKSDMGNRKHLITIFITLLNFKKMSYQFIKSKVTSEPVIKESEICRVMIMQARQARN